MTNGNVNSFWLCPFYHITHFYYEEDKEIYLPFCTNIHAQTNIDC